jgi:hypothetical protein
MKHRTNPQLKTLTHIYVRDAKSGFLRPCWASGRQILCGVCMSMNGVVQPEIGSRCPVCSSTVEHILRSDHGRIPDIPPASHDSAECCC